MLKQPSVSNQTGRFTKAVHLVCEGIQPYKGNRSTSDLLKIISNRTRPWAPFTSCIMESLAESGYLRSQSDGEAWQNKNDSITYKRQREKEWKAASEWYTVLRSQRRMPNRSTDAEGQVLLADLTSATSDQPFMVTIAPRIQLDQQPNTIIVSIIASTEAKIMSEDLTKFHDFMEILKGRLLSSARNILEKLVREINVQHDKNNRSIRFDQTCDVHFAFDVNFAELENHDQFLGTIHNDKVQDLGKLLPTHSSTVDPGPGSYLFQDLVAKILQARKMHQTIKFELPEELEQECELVKAIRGGIVLAHHIQLEDVVELKTLCAKAWGNFLSDPSPTANEVEIPFYLQGKMEQLKARFCDHFRQYLDKLAEQANDKGIKNAHHAKIASLSDGEILLILKHMKIDKDSDLDRLVDTARDDEIGKLYSQVRGNQRTTKIQQFVKGFLEKNRYSSGIKEWGLSFSQHRGRGCTSFQGYFSDPQQGVTTIVGLAGFDYGAIKSQTLEKEQFLQQCGENDLAESLANMPAKVAAVLNADLGFSRQEIEGTNALMPPSAARIMAEEFPYDMLQEIGYQLCA